MGAQPIYLYCLSAHTSSPAQAHASMVRAQVKRRLCWRNSSTAWIINWADHGVDIVLECTGAYTSKAKAQPLLEQGAKRVLISAPGGDDVDTTIVMGVNEGALKAGMTVVSNASCTTNCLAPVAKILSDAIGIKQGLMTTIHAYTNDQVTVDVRHHRIHQIHQNHLICRRRWNLHIHHIRIEE